MNERVRCYDCHRPKAHCLCALITPVLNQTEILILQHTRERSHAFNTARLAELSLERSEVVVGHIDRLASDAALEQKLEGAGLLYPSPGARDLSTIAPSERPTKLVVLDGTWHHARAMYRDIHALHDLPHFTLPAGQVSGFKIRKQPKDYCLSTIEAIQSALVCLEPKTPGLDSFLQPFETMQTQHLVASAAPAPRRRKEKQKPPVPRLPRVLIDEFESLVTVYGEMSPVTVKGELRDLITFAAERSSTGERMHCVLESAQSGTDRWPFLRITDEQLSAACSLEDLRRQWEAFVRPGDVMAAWSHATLRVITRHLNSEIPVVELKGHYFNQRPSRGCLEEIVVKEGLLSPAESLRQQTELSRTLERLWNATAIAGQVQRECGAKLAAAAARGVDRIG